jgi:hypothetical protein
VAVDNSAAGAIYKGLAIATTAAGTFLYAADFHNARVDVFDGTFATVTLRERSPTPAAQGFAPFGIQNLQGRIYVAYAKQDADAEDEMAGEGLGFVDVSTRRGCSWPASLRRDASTRRGAWRSLPPVRPVQRKPARGELRRREDQRLRPGDVRAPRATSRRPTTGRSRSTACGASASATAWDRVPPRRSTSPPAPTTRSHGLFGSITLN